ncbi:glycoside hydrolase family 28 protein [Larkinella harenae]
MKRRNWIEKMGIASLGALWSSGPAEAATGKQGKPRHADATERSVYNVRTFGATGNGKTNDAPAIQKAIDTCAKNGGGVVLLDKGRFLSTGIAFKSHVELRLTSTATLLGSPDLSRYNKDDKFGFSDSVRSLLYADGCQHIALTGSGTIDGQGKQFRSDRSYAERPQLIQLRGCQDVRISDVLLTNSGMWGCWLLQCVRVRVEGLRIKNLLSPNRDGIDIDGCREVFIANCNIDTEDDSIAFKGSEKGFPCRDVVITNCLISSRCAAIRLGPDAVDAIENITVSNCVIRNTHLNGIKIQETMGAAIQNITFSNIVMENVRGPISIRLAGWKLDPSIQIWAKFDDSHWEQGKLQNILFENIRGTMPRDNIAMSITGTTKTRPRQITFSNVDLTFAGGGTAAQGARRSVPDLERDYPEMYIFGELPAYGLYMHHVSGVVMNNVQFRLADDDQRPALVCDDVDDLELAGFKVAGSARAESVIRLQNTRHVFIHTSRVLNETGTFLRVEGAQSRDILLTGNKLQLARNVLDTATDVPNDAALLAHNY